jgi:hypothetical protein
MEHNCASQPPDLVCKTDAAPNLKVKLKRKSRRIVPISLQVAPTTLDLRKARRVASKVRASKACSFCSSSRTKCTLSRPCHRCQKIGKADACAAEAQVSCMFRFLFTCLNHLILVSSDIKCCGAARQFHAIFFRVFKVLRAFANLTHLRSNTD